MYSIYKIEYPDGTYIGLSKYLKTRLGKHKHKQRLLKKYSEEEISNLKLEVIYNCPDGFDITYYLFLEKFYIQLFSLSNNVINIYKTPRAPKASRTIITPKGHFKTYIDAAFAHGINKVTCRKWCERGWFGFSSVIK